VHSICNAPSQYPSESDEAPHPHVAVPSAEQSTNVIDYCQVKGPAGTGPNGNLYFGKTGSGEDGKFALKKFSVEQIVSVNEAV
jgi:hypothetical protein